ncbi:alpha/beta fold hydrolase [Brevundimonas sp.]|uniref:alpha/beta fold hydrolase n=1 Tax=Brevundimonas sp. TaxID=1871086 RepID=UPI00262AB8E2|nr:alpha/beta fold hydrolase [Brevundimonas sp.]
MRSQVLSVAVIAAGLITACASSPSTAAPETRIAAAASQSGQLVRFEPIDQLDLATLQQTASELPGAIAVNNGVRLYRLVYRSSVRGQAIDASALVAVPDTQGPPRGVVLYLRGSDIPRNAAPSTPNGIWTNEAAVFGGNGFVTIVPDYIGFGASPSPQAFLLTDENVADFRAALTAAQEELALGTHTPLFITGFSQGGQLSAALHRDLDARPLHGYDLRETVAVAGPHELVRTFAARIEEPLASNPIAMGYVAWAAYTFAWREGRRLEEVFAPAYVAQAPRWFGGSMSMIELLGEAPGSITEVLRPEFLASVRTDRDFWFNRMVRENETYDWAPRAPLHVILGTADDHVDPAATRILYERARARGGNVSIQEFPGFNHMQTGGAAYAPTLARFEALAAVPQTRR